MKDPDWTLGYPTANEYTSGLYPELNPDNLLALANLQGLVPSPHCLAARPKNKLAGRTYCELGSGQGITLIFLAARDPEGSYIGIDFNPSHVRNAQNFAREAGIENVRFIECSFGDLDKADIPECDFIVAHGIWSWINEAMRVAVRAFIQNRLKPGGLFYLSYNCAAGRSADEPMRRLFQSLDRGEHDVLQRMSAIYQATEVIFEQKAQFFANRAGTTTRWKSLKSQDPRYMEQEYMGGNWFNFYSNEVHEELSAVGLTFIGSSNHIRNLPEYAFPPGYLDQTKNRVSPHAIELLKDIFHDEPFRRDIFCKAAPDVDRKGAAGALASCTFALATPRSNCPLMIKLRFGQAKLPANPYSAILDTLARGPAIGADITTLCKAKGGHFDLLAVLSSLVAFRYIKPIADKKSAAQAVKRLRKFEDTYFERVASKVNRFIGVKLGSLDADQMSMIDYYFLRASRLDVADKPVWVYENLERTGRFVTFEGVAVRDKSESLRLLHTYQENHLAPLLEKMQH